MITPPVAGPNNEQKRRVQVTIFVTKGKSSSYDLSRNITILHPPLPNGQRSNPPTYCIPKDHHPSAESPLLSIKSFGGAPYIIFLREIESSGRPNKCQERIKGKRWSHGTRTLKFPPNVIKRMNSYKFYSDKLIIGMNMELQVIHTTDVLRFFHYHTNLF